MRVPYNWLKEYIDFPYQPEELALKLTMAGLEVEEMKYLGEGIEEIIIGKIEKIEDHPDADKLVVCKVNIGTEVKQMITGAPNVKEGARVPVAKPGTTLPTGLKIEETKLRGVKSSGMICSKDELGLVEERQDGIMILPDSMEVGNLFVSEYGLDDYVYKLDLTPNYARCLGLIGIAREIKAMLDNNKKIKLPEVSFDTCSDKIDDMIEIEIRDKDLCPRYTGRIIKNVEIKPSPHWIQMKLKAAGIRPVNNIVDITNYVLLEYNQPLHAFDYNKVVGNKVVVRRAHENEKVVTLDDTERELDQDVLVIADSNKPLGLAGVMGGANSEVTENTTDIFLESAYFEPLNIRKTAAKYGLHSEASHRFERGVDVENVIAASDRAAYLMQKYADGEIVEGIVEQYPQPWQAEKITLNTKRVNQLLGLNLEKQEIKDMLSRLEFTIRDEDEDEMVVEIPSYRGDVQQEADLIEEVARMYGYNNIPVTSPDHKQQGGRKASQQLKDIVKRELNAAGLDEVVTLSLTGRDDYENLQISEDSELRNWVNIKNPLNEAFSIMRTSLLPGVINVLSNNSKRRIDEMALFEIGRVFQAQEDDRPRENIHLAGGSMGFQDDIWKNEAPDFFYLKGIIENLMKKLKIQGLKFESCERPYLHPGRTALLKIDDQVIGYLGELTPEIIDDFNLIDGTTVFQIDYSILKEKSNYQDVVYDSLPQYPAVIRDLSVVVDEDFPVADIKNQMSETAGDLLEEIKLFDLYRGDPIPEGQKSLAFQLMFRSSEKTLTDSEVNELSSRMIKTLEDRFNAIIRGN